LGVNAGYLVDFPVRGLVLALGKYQRIHGSKDALPAGWGVVRH
jgi:hypothetical protein